MYLDVSFLTTYYATMHDSLMKILYQKNVEVHHFFDHFNFVDHSKSILVVGPMGCGKTEYARRIWKDSQIARKKSKRIANQTSSGSYDRRNVMYCRSSLDLLRFADVPPDALVSRGGYERMGDELCITTNSFDIESKIAEHNHIGTWIIDEAGFYDDRLAFVIEHAIATSKANFVLPTLLLNFRNQLFNTTTELLISRATDVYLLTAYCEHPNCLVSSHCTYRFYMIDGQECPAMYFDPLILIGGDKLSDTAYLPNYETRCEQHHYLPGMQYCYLHLKPMAIHASQGDCDALFAEFAAISEDIQSSALYASILKETNHTGNDIFIHALAVPLMVERILLYLYIELQLLSEELFSTIVHRFNLDTQYLYTRFHENTLREAPEILQNV